MSITSESSRIGTEQDIQKWRDRGYEPDAFRGEMSLPDDEWERKDAEEKAAITAVGEASWNHRQYSAAETSLKEAIMALEVTLVMYQDNFGNADQLWRLTSKEYQYTQELFAPCLAALKAAREFNSKRGEPTSKLLNEANERLNPADKKQAAERIKETETAVTFANKFVSWVSQFERDE